MINRQGSYSPNWVKKLLSVFLDRRTVEASLGDLEEKFQSRIKSNFPQWKAKLFFVLEGLGFLRMARLPKISGMQTTINMISHTFLFFGRLVRKDLSYYLISLLGLTLSLTSFLFIMMFIQDELSYDQFHKKKDRLFRLTTHLKLGDVEYNMASSQFPAAAAVQSELPEVEKTVRIFPEEVEVKKDDKKFTEDIIMADENFFDLFSFSWIAGDKPSALNEPASIILTEALAIKYFGSINPVGQKLLVYDEPLTVTGVINNIPKQSHLRFKAIIPLSFQLNSWKKETGLEGRENKWFWTGAYTYVLLKGSAAQEQAEAKLPAVINKYFPDRYKQQGAFHLQPVTDIHLTSGLESEMQPGGNILYVRLFTVVAFIIMIVSAINLINLSSFKVSSRMREVGIRKFLGQSTLRITIQLSMESVMIGVLAFGLTILLCALFIANFNVLVQKNLQLFSAPGITIAGITLAIIMVMCLMAVIRPAIRYATRPSQYLLRQKAGGPGHAGERNVLIGLQVCSSFVLMVFSFIVSSQIDFFKNKDLGFDKQNLVVTELNDDIHDHVEAFKEELRKSNNIVDVSGGPSPGGEHNGWRFVPEGGSEEKPFLFTLAWVDHDYLKTLKIKLLMGENFHPYETYKNDKLWPFLINKQTAIALGWADDPINKRMKVFAAGTTDIMAEGIVVGLIDDYHFESLHTPVKPIVLTVSPGYGTALIRTSGNLQKAITHMQHTWQKFSGKPFVYETLDEKLDKLYVNEAELSKLILFFTIIALYLTCYGMFAMSSLLFSSRLKEVAIRKVFGADQVVIVKQFYSRYAVFNLLAILGGIPIAIYLGNLWLQTFQYRIDLTASFFVKAAVCVLIVGLLSVSYYLLRVAFSNPMKFLRSE